MCQKRRRAPHASLEPRLKDREEARAAEDRLERNHREGEQVEEPEVPSPDEPPAAPCAQRDEDEPGDIENDDRKVYREHEKNGRTIDHRAPGCRGVCARRSVPPPSTRTVIWAGRPRSVRSS